MPPAGFELTVSATERPQAHSLSGYTPVTLPHNVTPYRDGVEETRNYVTYPMLVKR
jgi:hypothetical protein